MRTEITSERAAEIGGSTEAPPKFQDIQIVADETTPEVWVQNPPRPGRGRPTPYVQGLEFIVRRLANMLESALDTVKTLRRDVQRAKDDAADAHRIAEREKTKLEKENEALRKRVSDLEISEANQRRELSARQKDLEASAEQNQSAQTRMRLREEQHQEALDDLGKAQAEQLAALRAEQEREIDQLNEAHRQILEATEQDSKTAREELRVLKSTHKELEEQRQDLVEANESLEALAQQAYTLVKLIASVSVLIGPLRYVIFVDDADQAVEGPTYVISKDGELEIVHSKVLVHGQELGLDYTQGDEPTLVVASMESAAREIVEQQVPLDGEGLPTLAGLALLDWLQKAASGTDITPEGFENCPQLLRLTFENAIDSSETEQKES